jgi:hypothetical protein
MWGRFVVESVQHTGASCFFKAQPYPELTLSNAPANTTLRILVWLSGMRWAVEQYFEEGETALGMTTMQCGNIRAGTTTY